MSARAPGRRPGRGLVLLAGALLPATATADGAADLRLRELPAPAATTLQMRVAQERTIEGAIPRPGAEAEAQAAAEAEVSAGYRPIPQTRRDLEERVIARISAGYALDAAGLSGDLMRTGVDPAGVDDADGNALRSSRQYLMGDAVLGSRGVLMPSLNTYFLSRFRFDPDGASRYAVLTDVYDRRGGSDLVIRAGYAEVDGIGEGALAGVHVRAGRLFRGGSAVFVTNFDGATAGWRSEAVSLDGYVGRRVSLYPVDDPGLVGGASATVRTTVVVPVDLGVDYSFFGGVDDAGGAAVSRHALALTSRASIGPSRLYLRGRLVDRGDGLGVGRIGARLRHPVGRRLLVVADVEERFEDELAYDLVAADATDVVDARALPALGLEAPLASTLLGARADVMVTRTLEAFGFGRVSIVHGDSASHYTNGWQEGGVAAAATSGKLTTSAQIKVRAYSLDAGANGAGGAFADTSGSGVAGFRELSGEARYRLGERQGSASLGAYYRAYDFRSAYVEIDDDGRGGLRAEADYWPTKELRVAASGEIAQPSPTLARELSTLTSVRLIGEARF